MFVFVLQVSKFTMVNFVFTLLSFHLFLLFSSCRFQITCRFPCLMSLFGLLWLNLSSRRFFKLDVLSHIYRRFLGSCYNCCHFQILSFLHSCCFIVNVVLGFLSFRQISVVIPIITLLWCGGGCHLFRECLCLCT